MPLELLDIVAECAQIPVPSGELEAELAYPAVDRAKRAIVIVGPHPLLGGDMQNNLVAALAERLAATGSMTLRFNYEGVGASSGPRMLTASDCA